MSATFYIHLNPAEGGIVWWAETPDVAGLTIAADTLMELRRLIDESVREHLAGSRQVALVLVTDDEQTTESPESPAWLSDMRPADAPSVGPAVRRSLLRVA